MIQEVLYFFPKETNNKVNFKVKAQKQTRLLSDLYISLVKVPE